MKTDNCLFVRNEVSKKAVWDEKSRNYKSNSSICFFVISILNSQKTCKDYIFDVQSFSMAFYNRTKLIVGIKTICRECTF